MGLVWTPSLILILLMVDCTEYRVIPQQRFLSSYCRLPRCAHSLLCGRHLIASVRPFFVWLSLPFLSSFGGWAWTLASPSCRQGCFKAIYLFWAFFCEWGDRRWLFLGYSWSPAWWGGRAAGRMSSDWWFLAGGVSRTDSRWLNFCSWIGGILIFFYFLRGSAAPWGKGHFRIRSSPLWGGQRRGFIEERLCGWLKI